jgi:flagellar FliL protein
MAKKPAKGKEAEDAAPAEGAGDEAAAKKKKMMMIGGGAAALLLVGGGGAYFFLGGSTPPSTPMAQVEEKKEPEKKAVFMDLPDMTVNLSSTDQRASYLRLKVTLEMSEEDSVEKITPKMPKVLDAFQIYLRELRATDLDGSAGVHRLKEELTRRINVAVHPAKVDAVLFKEILIQ